MRHAQSCRLITRLKTRFLRTKIPYRDVIKVVIVQTIYVIMLADGFLFQRSLIVGINHKKVTIPPVL